MTGRNFPHVGEPDTGAFEIFAPMEALEDTKQLSILETIRRVVVSLANVAVIGIIPRASTTSGAFKTASVQPTAAMSGYEP